MEEKNIISELKELVDLQVQYSKLKISRNVRETKENAQEKIGQVGKYLDEQAKSYGRSTDEVKEIKEKYAEQVKNLKDNFEAGILSIQEAKQRVEGLQIKAMARVAELKKEAKDIKKTDKYKSWKKTYDIYAKEAEKYKNAGDKEGFAKAMEELKRMRKDSPLYAINVEITKGKNYIDEAEKIIEEKEQKQKDLKKYYKKDLDLSAKGKTTAIAQVKKQNIIQRFVGSIINRIGGAKKFATSVINPWKENIINIKNEVVPNFIKSAKELAGNEIEKFKGIGKGIGEKVLGLIEKGRETKTTIINEIEGKIIDSTEKTKEKISNLNKNKPGMEL